jgi:putative Mg2+ transporter-C (MgtC) family protein
MDVEPLLEFMFKIGLSILVGGLIGFEREITKHPAGLKTHILVCMGSTIFMLISFFTSDDTSSDTIINLDRTRIAAGVVTGIGFLGAGVIFKEGASVKGLTTAASIWVTAAVGLLIGVSLYEVAIFVSLLIVAILFLLSYFERKVFKYREPELLRINIRDRPNVQSKLESKLEREGLKIAINNFKRREKCISFRYFVNFTRIIDKDRVIRSLLKNEDILEVGWIE